MRAFFRRVRTVYTDGVASRYTWIAPRRRRKAAGRLASWCYGQTPQHTVRWGLLLLATATVSATVLLLEMTLTRVFSVFLHYHYVFLVLAVALLGLGVGAMLGIAGRPRWWQRALQPLPQVLWQVCWGTGIMLIVVTFFLTQTTLASVLPLAAGFAFLPFLGAGLFLALVFSAAADRCRALYAADMFGASMGCLLSLPALQWLGAEHTLALAALAFLALAALLVRTTAPRCWALPILTCLCLGGLLGFKMAAGTLATQSMAVAHSRRHLGHILRTDPTARIVDSRWSALARTDVVAFSHEDQRHYAAFTDGGAATSLVLLPTTPGEWKRWDHDVGLFPYRSLPRQRALIIGSGGGRDVVLALRGGAQRITAVEVNPDVLRAVERFIPSARNVYHTPHVEVVRSDGRLFVRQTTQSFDLIVLPLVYTGAAQRQAGSLAETYVLTTEAFQDYLAHLTPQGHLVVQVHDAAEMLKVVFMGLEALARRGIAGTDALNHLLILQEAGDVDDVFIPLRAPLVMLKRAPYAPLEGQRQATLAHAMQLTPLFMPHVATASPLAGLLQGMAERSVQPGSATTQPATDARPFFYETAADLVSLSWVSLVVLLILLGLHVGYVVCRKSRADTASLPPAWLPFFAATGCAGLLAQVALLQRYMLLLGSPLLTLVVLLFPLLFFGGLGSLASTTLNDRTLRWVLPWSCVTLGCFFLFSLTAFPRLYALFASQGLLVRAVGVILSLAPVGILMGLPFPVALRLLSPVAAPVVPWVWGVNATGCVWGSVMAVRLAVSWGLPVVIGLSGGVYILAAGWAYYLLTKRPQPDVAYPSLY